MTEIPECITGFNYDVMTIYIQKVKGQFYCYIIKKNKNKTLLAIIQHHKSGTEGEIVAIFHI